MNPKEVYTLLDNDKRNHNKKFKDIKLFPTCYGGLLSCEYFIKIIFEIDSWFSSNEQIEIPIDLYEPYNIIENISKLNQKENININNSEQAFNIFSSSSQNIIKPNYNNVHINLKNEEQDLPTEEEILSHQKNDISNNNDVKQKEMEDDKSDLDFNLL